MLRYLSADYIFTVSGDPIKDGIVALHQDGEIDAVYTSEAAKSIAEPIERYQGIIVPGFVNTHCHLELSHLHGKIPKATGLVSFIKAVISQRTADEEEVLTALRKNDQLMSANGIVAVGDISNNHFSKSVKQNSRIYYHTFVELLGFDPAKAEIVFNKALELKSDFAPLPASIVPHAPYSVSEKLFSLLREYSESHENLCSMHNQESRAETDLFMNRSGDFLDFYKMLNLDLNFFKARYQSSIQSILPLFSAKQNTLLVHNTYTSREDLAAVTASGNDIYWCFCPNANLYIEGKLPDINQFLADDLKITIGTDSLASNDKLCILSELKVLKEYSPELPFSQTIRWATLNGAEFLGIDKRFGSIEKGKTPGLNLIQNADGLELTKHSTIRKLI
ncbi:MAG: amidohydrolase [Sphingobacteriales bacterium 17-39-43]|jgi:cytosine/adenosine deaminase-related metal-dependent hydrolase|uniref:amidohydrolase family protein n=1 Tax=Daejeonella sp. TaxID=2805397 RepID=UPI000BD4DF8D|nr:amidohydrolase family protein [Daejeonella sp.]OYY04600.1 MAG: amidohydrolase [Sphingobacteriia bacterium 35-40-5]OYZ31854.1 MAG: amidohydrolase [Sphingobacteriales bacterium 16-39-50]OYZ58058.1 MAG: amidohydrolase [Sphingobacteriales bacterium 24-40-4]OZA24821.1 MAG: amidohydrolase [Sphingobacteriales bacterium 17-39-43]HQS04590.1 amidohydrolase family protein [Daejeonella sp.]